MCVQGKEEVIVHLASLSKYYTVKKNTQNYIEYEIYTKDKI